MMSQKGRELIVIDGYAFAKQSRNIWRCSSRNSTSPKCEARLKLDDKKNIVSLFNEHAHPRKTVYVPQVDKYMRI